MSEEKETEQEKTERENYERLLLAIAVLYSADLDLDIRKQDSYGKLTEPQKMFAKKIYEETPSLAKQVSKGERLTEQQIVQDISELSQTKNNTKLLRIVTVGDGRVCEHCHRWDGKIISLDGSSSPSLDDAINDGFLHYGCRCALQELGTTEIPLKEPNPRIDIRKAANPAAYNSSLNGLKLVFN